MTYNKPSKKERDRNWMLSVGMVVGKPYEEETIDPNKTFLIVCEGANTEPHYFEGFPVASKTVLTEGGKGSKTALVNYALKIRDKEKYAGREVWCVFDFDIKPDEAETQPEDFNRSITLAEAHGIKVAWSNDSFELWFVLHYEDMTAQLTREEMYPKLKARWGIDSSKKMKELDFCREHYKRHQEDESANQQLAIRRARRMHEEFGARCDYANHTPCTTVYLLVEVLNQYIKR